MRLEQAPRSLPARRHILPESLRVCAGSWGPGNLHLINGLYERQRSRVPMLAIAAQIPCNEIGSSYFQETHPEHVFWAMQSLLRASFSPRADAPAFLEIAIQTAIARRRISVVAIPGDIALRESVESRRLYFPRRGQLFALPKTGLRRSQALSTSRARLRSLDALVGRELTLN
jgi:pyruvate dehydrogenase (quinone)